MNHQEATALARYVRSACPQQAFDDYTYDVWHDLLGDLDFADAHAAAIAVAKRQPFVAPAEIRAEVRRIRADRVSRAIPPAPPAELTDRPAEYAQAVRDNVRRIADGFAMPREIG